MAKLFSKAIMASEDIQSYVGSCLFMSNNAAAAVSDGSFVVLGGLATDTTYGGVDYNVYYATAPAAVTDNPVVIDYAGISEGSIADNSYKMGIKLFDLVAPAGRPVRFRRMAIGDKFWLGSDNFTGAIGNYATLTANSVLLTPAAGAGADFAVKIQASKDFVYGQSSNIVLLANASGNSQYNVSSYSADQIYLCEVVQL